VAAVQKHGSTLGTAPTSANMATVLVTSDLQQPDLGDAPPTVTNLHVTTVDHVLVSIVDAHTTACLFILLQPVLHNPGYMRCDTVQHRVCC